MTNKTLNKIILSATTAMFLTACGGGGSSTPTAAETASAKIQAYAVDGTKPKPTVADYAAVGITVAEADLIAMNALVDDKTKASEVDDKSDLEAILASLTTDTTAPVITLTAGATSVTVGGTYSDPGATANDDTDGNITANITTTITGDSSTVGNSIVIKYTVSDAAGHETTKERTVTVTAAADAVKPVITLLGNSSVDILINTPYTDAGATASDNIDGDISANITATSVDVNASGVQTITYTVSDAAGNPADAVTRTVDVKDSQFVAGTNTVTDLVSKLVWDKTASNVGTCVSPKSEPTIEQFQSIMDYAKSTPALVTGFDIDSSNTHYKTSDDWDIQLPLGQVSKLDTATKTICVDASAYVAPTATSLTRDATTKEVTDATSGLTWSDDATSTETVKLYAAALTACSDVGMRLPTLIELDAIYDRTGNTILTKFEAGNNGYYWTSNSVVSRENLNWAIRSDTGIIDGIRNDTDGSPDTAYYRCVK